MFISIMKNLQQKPLSLLLFFGFICAHVQLQAQTADYSTQIKKGQRIIQKLFRKEKIPGLAISVSVKGKTVWSEGYGYANLTGRIKVDPDSSQFRVASISKPFTATALAILYEQGLISLDKNVQYYTQAFPPKKYPITIRQLAGHLGGIRHYQGREFTNNIHYSSVSEGLSIFKNDSLIYKPGQKFHYSSYGYNLLSAAMEGASGQPFLQLMDNIVFCSLGMHMTCADKKDSLLIHRTNFYSKRKGKIVEASEVDNSYKWAGGGFLSTAPDIIRFGNSYIYSSLLKKETIQLFTRPMKTAKGKSTYYGLGWQNWIDPNGRNWYGHSGGGVGATSELLIQPEEEIVIVILTNLTGAKTKKYLKQIAKSFTMPLP